MMGLKEGLKSEKPPAACAVGGLDNALLLNPVRQAPLSAFALGPLIRGLEIDKAMRITGVEFGLGIEERMTLIAVDQTSKWRVKTEALDLGQLQTANQRQITFESYERRMVCSRPGFWTIRQTIRCMMNGSPIICNFVE